MKNKAILYVLLSVGIVGLLAWSGYNWNIYTHTAVSPSPSASPSSSYVPIPSKNIKPGTSQNPGKIINGNGLIIPTSVPYAQLTSPATCHTEGTIKFLSPNTSVDEGTKLTYSGIDSPARQIKWKVSPSEDLRVGPNLMAQLSLPDGSSPVGVTLPANPQSKSYKLTVSMTYGRLAGEGVKVYEVKCSGEVNVLRAY